MSEASTKPSAQVRMVDVYDRSVRLVDAETLPPNKRAVFLKDGVEVKTADGADEIVPVVEVRRLTLNDEGELVSPEQATRIRIEEVGPGGRHLRWTSLLKRR